MIVITVVDNDPPKAHAEQLSRWVAEALSLRGTTAAMVTYRAYQVSEGAPAWDRALHEISRDKPQVVFADDFMPEMGGGVRFIQSLRRLGYDGYTYLHTGVKNREPLRRVVNAEPLLLDAHGSGAVRKGERDDVIRLLSLHLLDGDKLKLPPFRVAAPSSFLLRGDLDMDAALGLLGGLYDFQLYFELAELNVESRETAFKNYMETFPEEERRETLDDWLAQTNLAVDVRQEFAATSGAAEWEKVLEKVRNHLLDGVA
jgi:CheY-like chemotaxis protein